MSQQFQWRTPNLVAKVRIPQILATGGEDHPQNDLRALPLYIRMLPDMFNFYMIF